MRSAPRVSYHQPAGVLRRQGEVDALHLTFFANWQCQAARAVAPHATSPEEAQELVAYAVALQDAVFDHRGHEIGLYERMRRVRVRVCCERTR